MTRQKNKFGTLAVTAALLANPLLVSQSSAADSPDADVSGVRIQLDNDLFAAGGDRDRDYTGGLAVTVSGPAARDSFVSLDPLVARLDRWLLPKSVQDPSVQDSAQASVQGGSVHHAMQFGLIAFTPEDLSATGPLYDDRPYASLLFLANGRVTLAADGRTAWVSNLTVGALGLEISRQAQEQIHRITGSDRPYGYAHQISANGEPTARYTLARQSLWIANPSGTFDVKTSLQGSVGYLTEASAAVSMRIGRFDSPWWGFAPELTDYTAAPVPVAQRQHGRPELYFFTGARAKARAYNAFLQGQFRHSEVKYSASEVEPLIFEAWVGVVTQLFEQTQLSYTVTCQTKEVRSGKAARDALWGAVQLIHRF